MVGDMKGGEIMDESTLNTIKLVLQILAYTLLGAFNAIKIWRLLKKKD